MSFKEELKKQANKINSSEEWKKTAEQKAREPIPEAELEELTEEICERVKDALSEAVSKQKIYYDYGKLLKNKKVNFRYQVSAKWEYHDVFPLAPEEGDDKCYEELLPRSNYYMLYSPSEWLPNQMDCASLHLKQIMTAVEDRLRKEEIEFSWEKVSVSKVSSEVIIKAFIKCDSKGNIK